MHTLVIATRNEHKVGEIRAILGKNFHYLTLKDFSKAPAVVEDAETFAGNATKKAVELAEWISKDPKLKTQNSKLFTLADDSGLEVDALGGAPGVHSARFAALNKTANSNDADNNSKLLRLLKDVPAEKRTARFRCVIAVAEFSPDPRPQTLAPSLFEGACEGRIQFEPRGHGGFGYDPLFVPAGFSESFAELGEATKNKLSHRAQALVKLRESAVLSR